MPAGKRDRLTLHGGRCYSPGFVPPRVFPCPARQLAACCSRSWPRRALPCPPPRESRRIIRLPQPDTSSPRATLASFVTTVDTIYADLRQSQPSPQLRERSRQRIARVASCLDLSQVAPSLVESKRQQVAVNLKEVLDRIELPPAAEIPDAAAVAADDLTRWRVPGTKITLVRLPEGGRAGEWVFATDTVDRAGKFYQLVESLPYRADAGSPGLHDMYVESPGWMIPEAWVRTLPDWSRRRFRDVTLWQRAAAATDPHPLHGTAFRERRRRKAQWRRPANFQPSSPFDTTWHRVATLQSAL